MHRCVYICVYVELLELILLFTICADSLFSGPFRLSGGMLKSPKMIVHPFTSISCWLISFEAIKEDALLIIISSCSLAYFSFISVSYDTFCLKFYSKKIAFLTVFWFTLA